LIDNVQQAVFKNKFKISSIIILKNIEIREGLINFDRHWENKESWVGTKNLVFRSGYIAPTLF
jgi:hypothetical protein